MKMDGLYPAALIQFKRLTLRSLLYHEDLSPPTTYTWPLVEHATLSLGLSAPQQMKGKRSRRRKDNEMTECARETSPLLYARVAGVLAGLYKHIKWR
jgi:hypothetical protein